MSSKQAKLTIGEKTENFHLIDKTGCPLKNIHFPQNHFIIDVYPTLEVGEPQKSLQTYQQALPAQANLVALVVSMDLPFALQRLTDGAFDRLIFTSDYQQHLFAETFHLNVTEGPYAGLLQRALLVIDQHKKLRYVETLNDTDVLPQYDKAVESIYLP